MESKLAEVEQLRKKLTESERTRVDLSQCLKESGSKTLVSAKSDEAFKAGILAKNKALLKEKQELEDQVQALQRERSKLAADLAHTQEKAMGLEITVVTLQYRLSHTLS